MYFRWQLPSQGEPGPSDPHILSSSSSRDVWYTLHPVAVLQLQSAGTVRQTVWGIPPSCPAGGFPLRQHPGHMPYLPTPLYGNDSVIQLWQLFSLDVCERSESSPDCDSCFRISVLRDTFNSLVAEVSWRRKTLVTVLFALGLGYCLLKYLVRLVMSALRLPVRSENDWAWMLSAW